MTKLDIIKLKVELITKILAFFSAIFVIIGYLIFFSYCSSFRYFPQGFSGSDNFTIILISITFLILYIIIAGCILSVSSYLWPLWSIINIPSKLFNHISKKLDKEKRLSIIPFYKGSLYLIPAVLIGSVILLKFIIIDLGILPNVILTLFLMTLIVSFFKNKDTTYVNFDNAFLSNIKKKPKELKKEKLSALILIVLIPLLFLGKTSFLMERSMELLGIRANSVNIIIEKSYYNIFDKNIFNQDFNYTNLDYVKIDNVDIMLQGLGDNVVIRIDLDDRQIIMPIPKEYILPVERILLK